jgi:uncharacterized iron-regulated membrane protein
MTETKAVLLVSVCLTLAFVAVVGVAIWWRERKRKRAPSVADAHLERP